VTRGYLLVGEAPNAATIHQAELWLLPDSSGIPHTANNLLKLSGYDLKTFLSVFPERTNVWTDPTRRLSAAEGRLRAEELRERCELQGIVAMGARAAKAFELPTELGLDAEPVLIPLSALVGPFVFRQGIAWIPHASGRNFRAWTGNKQQASEFFQQLAESVQ
jgi:hypothetical protein